MDGFKNFLLLLLLLNLLFPPSLSEKIPLISHCGSLKIQQPFLNQTSSHSSLLLSQMILCKSEKLYFRTSVGLFEIRSIDYENKLITISHRSCSPTSHFVSPHHLSAGFPSPSNSNSLILLNCSSRSSYAPLLPCNGTITSGLCGFQEQERHARRVPSCSFIDDVEKLDKGFDPKKIDCTHYSRVYRSSSKKIELGTRISFDIPDHVPNPCDECERSDGNCGAGLRCACHPKKCSQFLCSCTIYFFYFLLLLC